MIMYADDNNQFYPAPRELGYLICKQNIHSVT